MGLRTIQNRILVVSQPFLGVCFLIYLSKALQPSQYLEIERCHVRILTYLCATEMRGKLGATLFLAKKGLSKKQKCRAINRSAEAAKGTS